MRGVKMYNLLVGLEGDSVRRDRLFEYTESWIKTKMESGLRESLESLPVLALPEISDTGSEQVARVGTVSKFRESGRDYTFVFTPNPKIDPIPSGQIVSMAEDLGIDPGSWELTRTHWAVKDVDLYETLLEQRAGPIGPGGGDRFEPGLAAPFPTSEPRDPKLVAVMMPFAPSFDIVYEHIEAAVSKVGLVCKRADDMWEHDHVMHDVLSLLWRSQVVIADLTGKNANVFYEIGLAHALPRPSVLLTQSDEDVPFDLRSIRYLKYGLGTSDRNALQEQLSKRLRALVT